MSERDDLLSLETRIGQLLPTWSVHPDAASREDVAALASHAMALRAALLVAQDQVRHWMLVADAYRQDSEFLDQLEADYGDIRDGARAVAKQKAAALLADAQEPK